MLLLVHLNDMNFTHRFPCRDAGYFHVLFWIALFLSLTPFYPTLRGWIPEKVRSSREPGMVKLCKGFLFDKGSFVEKKAPFIVITLCGLSAPLLAALTTYADLAIGLSFAAVLITAFTVATYYIFPKSVSWHAYICTISRVICCLCSYLTHTFMFCWSSSSGYSCPLF